jgi:hypothetical protein
MHSPSARLEKCLESPVFLFDKTLLVTYLAKCVVGVNPGFRAKSTKVK